MRKSRMIPTFAIVALSALMLVGAIACSSGANSSQKEEASGSAATEAPAETSAATEAAPAEATSPEATSAAVEQTAPDGQEAVEAALAQGFQVFSGTVHVCTPEELIDLQGKDIDPAMVSNGGTYAVLVFDVPTEVAGMSADGSGERTETCNMLGIAEFTEYDSFVIEYGNLDEWRALDGQPATIAVLAKDITFPSDVRLPIGEPSASEVEIL